MSSKNQNLSSKANSDNLKSADKMRVAIVVSDWNSQITNKLLDGAYSTLLKAGCKESNIIVKRVPGAFELPMGVQLMLRTNVLDGVIALGCVVRGGTPHFEYVCQGTTYGIMEIQLNYNVPVAFGLLTVDDMEQAEDRAGGKYGNKGDEAAATLVDMMVLKDELEIEYYGKSEGDSDDLLDSDDLENDFLDVIAGSKKKHQFS